MTKNMKHFNVSRKRETLKGFCQILFSILFLLLTLPIFAHYTATPPSTTNGDGTWGSILWMGASIEMPNSSKVIFTLKKQDGAFEENNTLYLREGHWGPGGTLIGQGSVNSGVWEWTYDLPLSPSVNGKSYYIYAENVKGNAWVGPIKITYSNNPPNDPVVINEPTSGDTGQSLTYTYKISDPDSDRVKIRIGWGDGTGNWESGTVSSGSQVSTSHSYGLAGTYDLYVTVFDEHGIGSSVRHASIKITGTGSDAPTVTLNSPNSGAFKVGDQIPIDWTSNNQDHFGLYLLKGGDKVGTIFHTDSSAAQSYLWTVESTIEGHKINGSNYKIKVAVWNSAGVSDGDESDGTIMFNEQQIGTATIDIISPTNGQVVSGSSIKIKASIKSEIGIKKVELYLDNVLKDTIKLEQVTVYDYEYRWDTTKYKNNYYIIRIVAYDKRIKATESQVVVIVNNLPIKLENFNFSNTTRWANMFNVWVDITDKDGNALKRDNYKIQIVAQKDPSIILARTGYIEVEDKRWKILFYFDYENAQHGGPTPYFEDGIIQVQSVWDGETFDYTEMPISAYGTNFDMERHAFQFSNSEWDFEDDSLVVAEIVLDNYLKEESEDVFWKSILWFKLEVGLCYGISNSSIANFNYRNTNGYWGDDCPGTNCWKDVIESRGFPPTNRLKPYWAEDIYENTWDEETIWTLEAAKKITYYHLSQPFYYNHSKDKSTWVGKDNFCSALLSQMVDILKKGSPISLGLSMSNGGHQVVLTQILKWKNTVKLVVYDPNEPYVDPYSNKSPFSEIWFEKVEKGKEINFKDKKLCNIKKTDGNGFSCIDLKAGYIMQEGDDDSQNIYIYAQNESAKVWHYHGRLNVEEKNQQINIDVKKMNEYIDKGYMEIVIIGARNFEANNSTLGQMVEFVKNGDLNGMEAVYFHEPGSILTLLYLPIGDEFRYQVKVTKDPQIPCLKIFPNVPKGEHLEKRGYNNIHSTLNDETEATFWVGVGNTDYTLHRTSGKGKKDKLKPDYVKNIPIEKSFTIISPNGSENWLSGSPHAISWGSSGPVTGVKIEYSLDEGANYIEIIHRTTNDGSYIWEIPYNIKSSTCLIRISDVTDETIYDISDTTFTITDEIQGKTILNLSRQELVFSAVPRYGVTGPQKVFINIDGGETVDWTVVASDNWIKVSPDSGKGKSAITVSVNIAGLTIGTYTGTVTITAPNALDSPQTINVKLEVQASGGMPFGVFASPKDGSKVSGVVPVSGWALDDIGVAHVQIYRGDKNARVYIGDAMFVEGARPDVEQAYPDFPMNYRCGWGYMLLSNTLPNNGNGTFKLYAIATDIEGNQVELGTTTIICDNANAVKPFGTIDNPGMGEIASGKRYENTGWVLTPMPNKIPEDGSTIRVFVDGVKLGNTKYNIFRSDIADLFPGYANSSGAGGSFQLDTTPYRNGIHTIEWVAEDDAGNKDGIGSRYFTVLNTGGSNAAQVSTYQEYHRLLDIVDIPLDYQASPGVIKGYKRDMAPQMTVPGLNRKFQVEISELEQVEIHLNPLSTGIQNEVSGFDDHYFVGYQVVGEQLRPLPVGSTMDMQRGVFYWQPGVGFSGLYRFVFIERGGKEEMAKKFLNIKISPKFPVIGK